MRKIILGIVFLLFVLSFCLSLGYFSTYIFKLDCKPEWYETGLTLFWFICSSIGMIISGTYYNIE